MKAAASKKAKDEPPKPTPLQLFYEFHPVGSLDISSAGVNHVIASAMKKIEAIEADKKKKPYAIKFTTENIAMLTAFTLAKPDPKIDDQFLEESYEPKAALIDTCQTLDKLQKFEQVSFQTEESPFKLERTGSSVSRAKTGSQQVKLSRLSTFNQTQSGVQRSPRRHKTLEKVDPRLEPQKISISQYVFKDELSEDVLDMFRRNLAQKKYYKQKEFEAFSGQNIKSRVHNKEQEIAKKEHTYTTQGKIIEVKRSNGDRLPVLTARDPRTQINDSVNTQESEMNRQARIKNKRRVTESHISMKSEPKIPVSNPRSNMQLIGADEYLNLRDNLEPSKGVNLNENKAVRKTGGPFKVGDPNLTCFSILEYRAKQSNHDPLENFKERASALKGDMSPHRVDILSAQQDINHEHMFSSFDNNQTFESVKPLKTRTKSRGRIILKSKHDTTELFDVTHKQTIEPSLKSSNINIGQMLSGRQTQERNFGFGVHGFSRTKNNHDSLKHGRMTSVDIQHSNERVVSNRDELNKMVVQMNVSRPGTQGASGRQKSVGKPNFKTVKISDLSQDSNKITLSKKRFLANKNLYKDSIHLGQPPLGKSLGHGLYDVSDKTSI